MSMKQLGPIDVSCEAPPYPIVKACQLVQFKRPEDVRWLRASNYLEFMGNRLEGLEVDTWKSFLSSQGPIGTSCSCGRRLPLLDKYQFFFASGSRTHFLLGQ